MSMKIKTVAAAVALATTVGLSAQQATAVSLATVGVGDPGFIVGFGDTAFTGVTYNGVGSVFTWALDSVTQSGSAYTFNFDLNINNTSSGGSGDNRITAFAFGTDPTLSSDNITVTSGGEAVSFTTGAFQAGFQNMIGLDLCVFAAQNCQSAANTFAGSGQSISLALGLTVNQSTLDFTGFGVRMASLENGASAVFSQLNVTPIPLPAAA